MSRECVWAYTYPAWGWERLQERGHFIQPASARDEVEALMRGGGEVPAFVVDECALDDVGTPDESKVFILKDELHRGYRRWCEDKKEDHPLGLDTFCQRIKEAYPVIRDFRPREGAHRPRYLMGIRLLTEMEKTERARQEKQPGPPSGAV
jgi:putative DNA primase/helicase